MWAQLLYTFEGWVRAHLPSVVSKDSGDWTDRRHALP